MRLRMELGKGDGWAEAPDVKLLHCRGHATLSNMRTTHTCIHLHLRPAMDGKHWNDGKKESYLLCVSSPWFWVLPDENVSCIVQWGRAAAVAAKWALWCGSWRSHPTADFRPRLAGFSSQRQTVSLMHPQWRCWRHNVPQICRPNPR